MEVGTIKVPQLPSISNFSVIEKASLESEKESVVIENATKSVLPTKEDVSLTKDSFPTELLVKNMNKNDLVGITLNKEEISKSDTPPLYTHTFSNEIKMPSLQTETKKVIKSTQEITPQGSFSKKEAQELSALYGNEIVNSSKNSNGFINKKEFSSILASSLSFPPINIQSQAQQKSLFSVNV